MHQLRKLGNTTVLAMAMLLGLFISAAHGTDTIVLDTTGNAAGSTTRGSGNAAVLRVDAGTTTTINAFTVKIDPASNGNVKFFIANSANTVVFITAPQTLTDVGVGNYRSPTFAPFTLQAGQTYYLGATADVTVTYYYDASGVPITQNGLTGFPRNSNFTNYASPTFSSSGGVVMGAQLISSTTAADVSVTGRVVNSSGSGLRGAVVTFTGSNGLRYRTTTNAFGYYSLAGVPSGETYIGNVSYRGHVFVPRAVTARDTLTGVDFAAR